MNKQDRIADRRVSCMPGGSRPYVFQMLESWSSGKKFKKKEGGAVNRSRSTKPLLSSTMLQMAIFTSLPICSVAGSSGTRRYLAWSCSATWPGILRIYFWECCTKWMISWSSYSKQCWLLFYSYLEHWPSFSTFDTLLLWLLSIPLRSLESQVQFANYLVFSKTDMK